MEYGNVVQLVIHSLHVELCYCYVEQFIPAGNIIMLSSTQLTYPNARESFKHNN